VQVTSAERLILVMLCEIYKKLGIDGDIDPEFVLNTLYSGQHWGFEWKYDNLLRAEGADEKTVDETSDFLDMWYILETSFENLPKEDKERVQNGNILTRDGVKFPGFDLNNDPHFGVARYLIEDMKRFDHFKDRYLNSHSQNLGRHRRMYEKFDPIRAELHSRGLSADEILHIFGN
jgi:uncharacterized protein YfbU (UPF0304 family)